MLINGNEVKSFWFNKLYDEVHMMKNKPILAIITVGDDSASKSYVKNKIKTANDLNINAKHIILSNNSTEIDIMSKINEIATNRDANGIIVQLPIKSNHPVNIQRILNSIPKHMDVDCLGDKMYSDFINNVPTAVPPCTSQAVMDVLSYYNIPLRGLNVAIVGRSKLVGRGLIELLLRKDSTITVAHSKSNLALSLKNKEVIISSTGIKDLINKDNIDKINNKVFINVGLSRGENGFLCGDISEEITTNNNDILITPYSTGGVGPLTVINLMKNLIKLTKQQELFFKNTLVKL